MIEPLAPRAVCGKRREALDERKSGLAQVPHVADLAVEVCRARGGGVVLEGRAPELQLFFESAEAARPPVLAPDHGRLDEQLLPAPRLADRSVDHTRGLGIPRGGA